MKEREFADVVRVKIVSVPSLGSKRMHKENGEGGKGGGIDALSTKKLEATDDGEITVNSSGDALLKQLGLESPCLLSHQTVPQVQQWAVEQLTGLERPPPANAKAPATYACKMPWYAHCDRTRSSRPGLQ